MKFEVGKLYKDPSGDKVMVVDVEQDGSCAAYNYVSLAISCYDRDSNLEEWKEPRKGTFWVNVYDDDALMFHTSREDADKYKDKSRLACVKVEWTENQGLEDGHE